MPQPGKLPRQRGNSIPMVMISRFVMFAALLLAASGRGAPAIAQEQPVQADFGDVQVEVVKSSLLNYSSSKLVIGLTLNVGSQRDLTVEQIRFSDLRINGLPLYAAPVNQPIQLHANAKTMLAAPLAVTIYLRDLDSVAPLHDAVASGHFTLDGTAYITVRVKPLARLVLFSSHAEVAPRIHQEVPFTVPGGRLATRAVLKLLQATETALRAVSTTVNSGRNWAYTFRHQAVKEYLPHVVFVRSRFELRDEDGNTTASEWRGAGVAIAPDQVVVPKEALEPWKFNSEIAEAIAAKQLSLVPGSYDLWIWPSSAPVSNAAGQWNADTAMRLNKQQVSVLRQPKDDKRKVLDVENSSRPKKVSVEKRESSANVVLLGLAKADPRFGGLKIAGDSAEKWESVAIFRFRDVLRGAPAEPELILLPAKRHGDRIELEEQVDSSVFGSPIIAPEGVIGIIQDENGGAAWPEVARVLKLEKVQAR